MARVVLKSLEGGPKAVVIPAGKTVIGRGPLLGCGDKKVSRKHAVLEVTESGDVYLTPIHVNPCFYHPNSEKTAKILKKDTAQKLEPGDSFSLLPRAFRYQVMMGDYQKDEEQENKIQNNKDVESVQENADEEIKMEQEEQTADDYATEKVETEKAADSPELENDDDDDDDDDEDEGDDDDDIKEESDTMQLNGEKQCAENNAADDSHVIFSEKEEAKSKQKNTNNHGDNKAAKLSERKRTLPDWLLKCAISPNIETAEQKTTKRRYATGTKPKKETTKRHMYSDSENEERPSKARSSRQNRQTRQGISLEDFIVSDDDEWDSDESHTQRSRRRRGLKKDEDSGSDWEAEHRKKRRSYRVDSGSESGSDWETENRKKKLPKKSRRGKTRFSKDISDDDDDDDEIEEAFSSKNRRRRKPCSYGKECYRKNPIHFEDYSHPGDSDYNSDPTNESDDGEIPECPYGIDCYRKNSQHRKEYRHTKKVRPKREAAKKAGKRQNDDDDEPEDSNMNDLNDEESDDYEPQESASDWEPEGDSDGEDVNRLMKEAKGFVQNKASKQV
ncbi:aprataxin and PNK-like factor [Centruroides vittatus]|uniref:aprataxin and PNK-like factor n=1 Tax=Centruroides vittatus TaxID=120091 RepID=UPI0035109B72